MRSRGELARACAALIMAVCVALSAVAGERVRESALAGGWYPNDPVELAEYVDALLDAAQAEPLQESIRALIAPHAGYRFSGATAAEAFSLVRSRTYRRVMVLAPAHRSGFAGLSIADVDAYETPLGPIELDAEAIGALRKSDLVTAEPFAHRREHAIEIELPFLQRALEPGWRLVPILVGQLDAAAYEAAAQLLRPLLDEGALLVVSSDFTHYGPRFGYIPFPLDSETADKIRALDEGAIERIRALDGPGLLEYQAQTGITVCGYRPLALLLHLVPADARVDRLAYTTSGELTGEYDQSVSYAAMVVTAPTPFSGSETEKEDAAGTLEDADLRTLHRLALLGVELAVLGQSEARETSIKQLLDGLPSRLRDPAGAFVTLKRDGQLRGCIGYVMSRKPLYQAVLENGVNAARNDLRFPPVGPDELGDLEVEVSVLSLPQPIASPGEFRVGEQGIILRKDDRKALFLPEVAREQGWTSDDTLSHLALKARLPADGWREGASFEVFHSAKYAAPYRAATPVAGNSRAEGLSTASE